MNIGTSRPFVIVELSIRQRAPLRALQSPARMTLPARLPGMGRENYRWP